MKFSRLLALALLACLVPSFLRANKDAEAALVAVVREIESGGSLVRLPEIYLPGDAPQTMVMSTHSQFEALVSRGIERIDFTEIYPMMLERVTRPVVIEGRTYTINVAPYKMLEVGYAKKIEGGSSGFSLLVGVKDGRLWIAGLEALAK